MSYSYQQAEAIRKAKIQAAVALTRVGEFMDGTEPTAEVVAACTRRFFPKLRGESNLDYFTRVAKERPDVATSYCPQVVEPFTPDLIHREAYVMKMPANPRAAYMDTLPHPVSVHGVGNGREDHSQFVRGK